MNGAPLRHLTLVGLTAGYAVAAGVGYLVAGATGTGCGAGLVTLWAAWQIWCAASAPVDAGAVPTWPAAADAYREQTKPQGDRLSSLPAEWQRELAALKLLDDGVNRGGYLTFFVNHGREVARYAAQALRAIGASRAAAVVTRCQTLIEEHAPPDRPSRDLLPNEVLATDGTVLKPRGSVLPESVLARLRELSREYMAYPDEVGVLAQAHYGPLIAADGSGG